MKLHQNQLNLILHLIRLNIMAYDDCLKFWIRKTPEIWSPCPMSFAR